MSFLGTIIIMGTLEAVKAIDSARVRLQEPANYRVNLTKQYVYTTNDDLVRAQRPPGDLCRTRERLHALRHPSRRRALYHRQAQEQP